MEWVHETQNEGTAYLLLNKSRWLLILWQQTYPCDQIFSYLPFLWGNLACLISWFLCKSFYFLCHLPESSN